MTASIKIRQLESKISDLQTQHQILLQERQQEIAVLLSAIDLAHLDDRPLVGGLLFLKDKITNQDSTGRVLVEAWHAAGEKFLRRKKPKACTRPRDEHEGKEQAGTRPRISSEKHASFKQTTAPQTTDQSPQKQPCQRED